MNSEVVKILQGDVELTPIENPFTLWRNADFNLLHLDFAQGFRIRHSNWDEGIHNCIYQVCDKQFKDISFVKGKKLKTFATNDTIRYSLMLKKFPDSEKNFLYQCEEVPTFDSGDREWDSFKEIVIYFDEKIILIESSYGYKIPRIEIYFDLKKAEGDFIKWLIYTDCDSKNFPEVLK